MVWKYFKAAIIFGSLGIVLGSLVGFWEAAALVGLLVGMEVTGVLAMIESSMSLDNSVVASGLLEDMEPKWQKRYLVWGMPIATIGMRFLFPILVVSAALWITPWAALMMAIHHPAQYSAVIAAHENEIMAFGGSFLSMIFMTYMMDLEKDNHWIPAIEVPLSKFGEYPWMPFVVSALITVGTSFMVPAIQMTYIGCGAAGLVMFAFVKYVVPMITGLSDSGKMSGLGQFIHLECVDASFSFDGVIGAFAITTNIFYIAIGLGIGALVVRCLTLMLVDLKKSGGDGEFNHPIARYVENGAFFTIFCLLVLMYLGIVVHVPMFVTGLVGVVIIAASAITGLREGHIED